MPHIINGMAETQREVRKTAAQRRKPIRKGSPTHHRGKGSMICGSPPVRVFYRQDYFIDTQAQVEIAGGQVVPVPENESSGRVQDSVASSPLKVNNTAKSGAGIRHAPSPAFLPQPPKHWMGGDTDFEDQVLDVCIEKDASGSALSSQLKLLLKVQG